MGTDVDGQYESIRKKARYLFGEDESLFNNSDEISTQNFVNTKLKQDLGLEKLPKYLQDKIDGASKGRKSVLSRSNEEWLNKKLDEEVISYGDSSIISVVTKQTEINKDEVHSDALVVRNVNRDPEIPSFIDSGASRSLELFQQDHDQGLLNLQKPEWHPPWKLMTVIAGHTGWVRSLAMDPENQWFASGAADRTIKVWDLASSKLKLTLTGHIMAVRGIVISPRHPYMFSCSEDKTVKCWDLEKNKIIRDYHGHLSSVYSIDLHPTLDVIATGGRDSSVRIWDIRTRVPIHVLTGHDSSVTNVRCQATSPEILSTSMDGTVRAFDLTAGKLLHTLTHHKKAVRGIAVHEVENTFATASSDNIKQWRLPGCEFLQNFEPRHPAIVNTLSINHSNVMFSGADDGSMSFFDWKTGHKFQDTKTIRMPGSLESENGIYCSTFDRSGLRLITGEADKSIKVWREDPDATEESHPGIPWNPQRQ